MMVTPEADAWELGFTDGMKNRLADLHKFSGVKVLTRFLLQVYVYDGLIMSLEPRHIKARKSDHIYEDYDDDNRVKFIRDCIARAFGFSDRQIFRTTSEKWHQPIEGRQGVFFSLTETKELFGMDQSILEQALIVRESRK